MIGSGMVASGGQCPFRWVAVRLEIVRIVNAAVRKLTWGSRALHVSGGNCMCSLTLYRDGKTDDAPWRGARTALQAPADDKVSYNREDDDDVPRHSQPPAHDPGAPRGRRGPAHAGPAGAFRLPPHP